MKLAWLFGLIALAFAIWNFIGDQGFDGRGLLALVFVIAAIMRQYTYKEKQQ